jgi:hypothetical protein
MPIFVFTELTFVDRIYMLGMRDGDVMGCVYRDGAGPWLVKYRFRWYRDAKAWDSADEKHVHAMEAPDATDESRDKARSILEAMRQAPWAHMREQRLPPRG